MMISASKAKGLLLAKYPRLKVLSAVDYNSTYFIFEATDLREGEVDYDAPFYAVNKKTGAVCSYTPTADLDNFFDAFENRKIQI